MEVSAVLLFITFVFAGVLVAFLALKYVEWKKENYLFKSLSHRQL